MSEPTPLQREPLDRRHLVTPEDQEARADAIWARIEAPRRLRTRGTMIAAGVCAAAAAALLVLHSPAPDRRAALPRRSASVPETATAKVSPDGMPALSGVSYEVSPEARISVVHERGDRARLSLEQGTAELRVSREPGNPLEIELGERRLRIASARVRVTRIAFLAASHTVVKVESGDVIVWDATGERHISAGETVTFGVSQPEASPEITRDESAAEESIRDANTTTQHREHRAAQREEGRSHEIEASSAPSAKGLFDAASSRLAARDYAGAAQGYARLLELYPSDSRAPLAAFAMARVRMDKLADLRGGVEALERALSMSKALPFREEAMERLVRGYDALGDERACKAAREQYLKHFAGGRYVSAVLDRCAPSRASRP